MPIDNRAIRLRHDRDAKAEFADGASHLVDDGVVFTRVARVFNQPIDRPLLDRELVGKVHRCVSLARARALYRRKEFGWRISLTFRGGLRPTGLTAATSSSTIYDGAFAPSAEPEVDAVRSVRPGGSD